MYNSSLVRLLCGTAGLHQKTGSNPYSNLIKVERADLNREGVGSNVKI